MINESEQHEKTYSTQEAATYLGINRKQIYAEVYSRRLAFEKEGGKTSSYRFKQGNLDKWQEKAKKRELEREPEREQGVVLSEEQGSEERVMHEVMRELYRFLTQFEYSLTVHGFRKIEPGLVGIWEILTADIDLHIVTDGERAAVVSPQYQKYLETMNHELLKRLKQAETLLAFMRKKTVDYVLTDYSEDVLVKIEAREEGFLVTSGRFPFAALGKTEEEALKVFRGILFGYTYHLRTHEAELTPAMREQFHVLRALIVQE